MRMIPLTLGQPPNDPFDHLMETHFTKALDKARPSDDLRQRVLADFDDQYAVRKTALSSPALSSPALSSPAMNSASRDTPWPAQIAQAIQRLFGLSPVPAMTGAVFAMVIGCVTALNVPLLDRNPLTDQRVIIAEADTLSIQGTPEEILLALLSDLEVQNSATFDESVWQGEQTPAQSESDDGDRP
ncbi:MAG: hypothetical protein AAGK25_01110 [Pseudomonadota bacterium]